MKWIPFMILCVFVPFWCGYVVYGFFRWHGTDAIASAGCGAILASIVTVFMAQLFCDDEGGAQ